MKGYYAEVAASSLKSQGIDASSSLSFTGVYFGENFELLVFSIMSVNKGYYNHLSAVFLVNLFIFWP